MREWITKGAGFGESAQHTAHLASLQSWQAKQSRQEFFLRFRALSGVKTLPVSPGIFCQPILHPSLRIRFPRSYTIKTFDFVNCDDLQASFAETKPPYWEKRLPWPFLPGEMYYPLPLFCPAWIFYRSRPCPSHGHAPFCILPQEYRLAEARMAYRFKIDPL